MMRGSLRQRLYLVVLLSLIPAFAIHEAARWAHDVDVIRAWADASTRNIAVATLPLLQSALVVGDLATVQETLDNSMGQGRFSNMRLLDASAARVLVAGRPGLNPMAGQVPAWFASWLNIRFDSQHFPVIAGGTPYGILVVEPSSTILVAEIWRRLWSAGLFWLVTLILSLLFLSLTLRRGLAPLEDLAAAARRLGEGDADCRAPVSDIPELATTAESFNHMADKLAEARERLEERVRATVRELDSLISRIPAGVFKLLITARGDASYDFVSRHWCALLELDEDAVRRDPSAPLERLHPDEVEGYVRRFEEAGKSLSPFNWEGRLREGLGASWVRIEALPTRLENGDTLWEGIQYDISASKEAEFLLRANEEKLRGLFELSPLGIALTDMSGRYLEFNEAFRAICGYTAEELRLLDYWTLTPRKYEAEERRQLESLERFGRYGPFEKEYQRKDGTLVPLSLNGMLVKSPEGEPRIWSIVEDISRKKLDEAALRETVRELDNLITRIPAGVYKLRTPREGGMRFEYVSPRFCELLEMDAATLYGDAAAAFSCLHPDDVEGFLQLNDSALRALTPFQWEGRTRDGLRARWLHIESSPILLENGDVLWEGVQYDISANKAREAVLDHIAHYDPLTGLPNRVLLSDRLRLAIAQAERAGSVLAVCFLDLDGFKPVNDTLGHEAGDTLLVEIARRLHGAVRGGDTVARMGGDEFVLLLAGVDGMDEYETILKRVLDSVQDPFTVAGQQVSVSASMGIALFPKDDVDPDLLLRHADHAMYQAKQGGRARFIFFDPRMEDAARKHRDLLQQVEAGLADNQFELFYEPRVNMRRGAVMGFEALIHWRHPRQGLLASRDFLPHIGDNDLIVALGEWVMGQALKQLADWRRRGHDLSVSVNVAARQLQRGDFSARLRRLLDCHPDVPPERLEIEIQETAALADTTHFTEVVQECRRMGVSFALDGFGSGYSSLTYLKDLPTQTLKIDQSFVRDMLHDANHLAIVEGVIGLTEIFRRRVVAEGVETTRHGALLLNMGCEIAQGHGIAHPMPAGEVEAWLRDWRPDPSWRTESPEHWARDDLPLLVAENNHLAWFANLAAYLGGDRVEPPEMDAIHCRFGHWYGGPGRRRYGNLPEFTAIAPVHEHIHGLGRDLVAMANDGRRDLALARLPELVVLRDELLDRLRRLLAATSSTP